MKQSFNNLPTELTIQSRFFLVGENKVPLTKDWSNPYNQKKYTEINGIAGFDISGHDIAQNYLVLDWDHVVDPVTGEWISEYAKKIFYWILQHVHTFTERSISKTGFHMILLPNEEKFNSNTFRGIHHLYFIEGNKDTKLELFYKTGGRYFLFTGDVFGCEPKTRIARGEKVDNLFEDLIKKCAESQNLIKPKNSQQEGLIYSSADKDYSKSRSENIIINNPKLSSYNDSDYDRTRAIRMLDFIDSSCGYTDWLNVGMALKNIGCSVNDWDNWSSKSADKYEPGLCEKKWDSFNRSGLNIGTIHDLAKAGGYDEKTFKREYYQTHQEVPKISNSASQESYNYEKPAIVNEEGERLKAELEIAKKNAPPNLTDEMLVKFLKSYLTDLDCADLFCSVYKEYRYNRSTKSWYHFDGCKWAEEDDEKPLLALWAPIIKCATLKAHLYAETLQFENDNKIKLHHSKKIKRAWKIFNCLVPYQNLRKLNSVVNTIAIRPDTFLNDTMFNPDKFLFNTPNATINLKNLQVKEHNMFDYCTMSASAALDKDFFRILDEDRKGINHTCEEWNNLLDQTKKCSEWEAFIESAVPDFKTRKLLQKYMGYCMSGLTSLKVFMFIHGMADTGKSLFIRTMKKIFGDYAKTFPIEYVTANRKELNGEEPTPILFNMRHCRLAISSETKENRKLDTAKVKMLTGEDPVTARTLHKPPIEFLPQFKFLFVGNFAPKVDNIHDSGVRTRLRIIPFNHVPKKKNTKLDDIFSREENKMAILNWVIQGAFEVMKDIENGINPFDLDNLSIEMKKALEKFYDGNDNIPIFVEDEEYQFVEYKTTKVKDIWLAYLVWCKANDERHLRRSDFEEHMLTRYADKGLAIIYDPDSHKGKIFRGIGKAA